jgi:hypothetical protein
MLAARLEQHDSHGRGSVAVVALADDPGVMKARNVVVPALTDSHVDRLRFLTIENLLDVTDELAPELSWWTTSFRRRYVEHTLPDAQGTGRDPLGPVMGRTLADTAAAAQQAG